jgi:hypothetical protein
MTPDGKLTGCEQITALIVTLRRPASLRRALARSAADASRIAGSTSSRDAARIQFEALLLDDSYCGAVSLPPPEALDKAFAISCTRAEEITGRILAAQMHESHHPLARTILDGGVAPSQLTMTNLVA